MNTLIGILIGLFVLMALVTAHEFGHFITARKNGVTVEEFGIGFPPRAKAWVKNPEYIKWKEKFEKFRKDEKGTLEEKIAELKKLKAEKPKKWLKLAKKDWEKKQKTLVFSINWLPIGGFCAMKGESDNDKTKGSFGSASYWSKTKILFGGVAFNWLAAFIILTILSFTGMPEFMENQFHVQSDTSVKAGKVIANSVLKDSPAEKAGITSGQPIKTLKYQDKELEVLTTSDIITFNNDHAGKEVTYTICEDDECSKTKELPVKLNTKDSEYLLGVSMAQTGQTLYKSTWSAPITGAVTTLQLTGETFRGLWNMVWDLCSGVASQLSPDSAVREAGQQSIKAAGDSVSGPVGIIGVIFPALSQTGLTNIAFLAAVISVSLACMNVLPIPALDGGRWFLITLFRLRRKTLTKETEEKIVSRAFMVLFFLIILVTILDIKRLF